MAAKQATEWRGEVTFPVIVRQVLGQVSVGGDGPMTAHEAAFGIIARNDTEGTYEFPMADGRWCVVDVAYRDLS